MKKIIFVLAIAITATTAYAACRTYTVIKPDGSSVFCMECCNGDHCNVTCN